MSQPSNTRSRIIPMARDGWRFILPLLAVACISLIFSCPYGFGAFLILALAVGGFFRDPARETPQNPNLLIAPADGKLRYIEEVKVEGPDGEQRAMRRLSIVLSIFNVHIQRTPVRGKVVRVKYNKGKFLNAFNDKSSDENENNMIWIDSHVGPVGVRQIAGLVARRVLCWRSEGDPVGIGQRIGLIRFGSRVEVFLPLEATVRAREGENVKAGLSVLAEMPTE